VTHIPPTDCARAREAVSARVDGELSEHEGIELDRHLRSCTACFAHAARVGSVAIALRGATLEQPSRPVFVARPPRSPVLRRRAAAAGAALLVAAGAGSAVLGVLLGSGGASRPQPVSAADARSARADSTEQHLQTMLSSVLVPSPGRMQAV
jgi:anti-sigma factor RsiW